MASFKKVTMFDVPGTDLIFRNFRGDPTNVDTVGGKHLFAVCIDPEMGESLSAEGWNVKYPKSKDYDRPYLPVEISFGNSRFPSECHIITSISETVIDDSMSQEDIKKALRRIDNLAIEHFDIVIRPYNYAPGKVKAYAESLDIFVEDDPIAIRRAERMKRRQERNSESCDEPF